MHRTPQNSTDQEMVEDPDSWPVWPYLPMKRRSPETGQLEHGYFFNSSTTNNKALVFYTGGLYDPTPGAKKPTGLAVEQVLAAGWRVD